MGCSRKVSAVFAITALLVIGSRAQGQTPVLRGWLDADSVFSALPEWHDLYKAFQPDTLALKVLKSWNLDQEVTVFFGSWCGDSRREVPRFLKTVDLLGNPHVRYRLFGLDRSKRDPDGLAQRHHISRVPTFIVLEDGKELGRIVESPRHGVERDWAGILLEDPDWCVRIEGAALVFRALIPTFFIPMYLGP